MKRRSRSSKNSRQVQNQSPRLIDKPPVAYLGPGAFAALTKGSGLLMGAQRPGWVDMLAYDPHPGASCKELVARRFDDAPEWDVVGIVLSKEELEHRHDFLVREMVPGDVVLALSDDDTPPQVFVNLGDTWTPTRLKMSRAGTATSARSRRRSR